MAIVKDFNVKMRLASFVLTYLPVNIPCGLVCLYLPSAVNLISTLKITSRTYFLRRVSLSE